MKKIVLIISLLLNGVLSFADDTICNCKEHYNFLQSFLEKNYIDYDNNAKRRMLEGEILKKLRLNYNNVYDCYTLLKKYITSFDDPHLTLRFNSFGTNRNGVKELFSINKTSFLSLNDIKSDIYSSNNVIGEYESVFYNMRIRIIKIKDVHYGIVLRSDNLFWYPDQIKFVFSLHKKRYGKSTYFGKDHIAKQYPFSFHDNILSIINADEFVKDTIGGDKSNPKNCSYKILSDSSSLLVLPDFDISNKPIIDSIVSRCYQDIVTRPNLIIDLRGNLGGSSSCFDTLITIVGSDGKYNYDGAVMKPTETNYINYASGFKDYDTTYSSDSIINILRNTKPNKEQLIELYKKSTFELSGSLKSPKKVLIIIDGGVNSAAESFVEFAKQSNKVIVIGQSTRGGFKNLNARFVDFPYELFRFSYPLTQKLIKSNKKMGILPHIKLGLKTYQNWVTWGQNYLESNP